MAANYDDILGQLRSAGLIIDGLDVGRIVRCKVDGDRERRGWYMLHEIVAGNGDRLLVGSYGVWRGGDNGAIKLDVRKSDFTAEQRELLRARLREDRRKADQLRDAEAKKAAARAAAVWAKCQPTGDAEYLARKGVGAHGVRFSPSGALVIPLLDTAGTIHGLQVIRSRKGAHAEHKPEKEFWPAGLAKKAHFHLIGMPTWIVLIAEGYATAASLHEATGLPVAVAWDAGNMAPVAQALRARYKTAKILLCADDDSFAKCPNKDCSARILLALNPTHCPACRTEHKRINTGLVSASTAAVAVQGSFVLPIFADDDARDKKYTDSGIKLTDFNDLHATEGLHVVRTQIEAHITALNWRPKTRAAAVTTQTGGRGKVPLRPIETLDDMLERYALVYGAKETAFDYAEHMNVSLADVRNLSITRELFKAWSEHPDRNIVRLENVGFDPAGKDPRVTCNMWSGWPTVPRAGKCDKLLELLRHMCAGETKKDQLYDWILRWIAYPLQHPGAKMKTCVVVHGPQGTGKNLFFEAVMAIYGDYAHIIDQDALEGQFNDWASRKLFLIADEVIAQAKELYHVKNKLKRFITGDWIRINPKNMGAWNERNHVNLVFLSNETMPSVLEEDDRRHAVLWTPKALPAEFYIDVAAEIEQGGIAALHDHLLNLDLAGFDEHTKPPLSDAKLKLVEMSLDSTSRFFYELIDNDIPGIRAAPALTAQVYAVYKGWCQTNGYKSAPINKLVAAFERRHHIRVERKRYRDDLGAVKGPLSVMYLGGVSKIECPPGREEQAWLGENIEAFGKQIKDWREAA